MPCPTITPCTECNECYDNCGCLNPTTFECITNPGAHTSLGITDEMNAKEALEALNETVEGILGNTGKVSLDAIDTCPEFLMDKIAAGLNISLQKIGTGCSAQLEISASTGGVPVDTKVKASINDTTAGALLDKIDTGIYLTKSILNPAGNEQLKLDVVPATLLSSDLDNQLTIGGDGKLKTLYTSPTGAETKVVAGVGVTVSGVGTTGDPYVVASNPTIQVARTCFDATWRPITLVAVANPNVIVAAGAPQYRYRFDGSIEFKGSLTLNVAFGAYSTSDRKYTVTIGNIPTTCVTITEQGGTVDMKGINYIDIPNTITQTYGYIIRKSTQNIIIEVQSAFQVATAKTIVINFEGCVSHPSF